MATELTTTNATNVNVGMMTKLQFGVTIDMTVKEFRIPFRINVDTFAEDGKADRDGRKF